ncbi:MAG: pyridoxal phosphate-dependent class II aminotransferase [Desulfobacteraceae bacterium]|nr:pyridoxal phosphate-dependent class II aminotransferase [Desulfobacteraceae bacterium]
MKQGHGGNVYKLAAELGCPESQIIDFSSNINPLGTMPQLISQLKDNLAVIGRLPEADSANLAIVFARACNTSPENVLAGSGTTQFIYALPQALKTQTALILGPAYSDYQDACRFNGVRFEYHFTDPDKGFVPDLNHFANKIAGFDTVFICNPNNPTGILIPRKDLYELCETHPKTRFIIDESYLPFVTEPERQSLLKINPPNTIVLHSLSKIFGIPGLRAGFVKASQSIIEGLEPHILPWSVNSMAQAAAFYLLNNPLITDDFIARTHRFVLNQRQRFIQKMAQLEALDCYPSSTSFILMRLASQLTSDSICKYLAKSAILIRNCSNFKGLSNKYIRISLKGKQDNDTLVNLLTKAINTQNQKRNTSFV